MRTVSVARVAILAAVLAALPGCAADKEPVALPDPGATATVTATPTPKPKPTKSRKPGEFDEATKRSAEKFVRAWWIAVNTTLDGRGADVEKLKPFYSSSCEVCRDYYKDAKELADAREQVRGGQQKVLRVRYETNRGGVALVDSVIRSLPGDLIDRDGNVVHRYSGGPSVRFVFNLVRTDKSWYIQDILALGATK